MVNIVDGIPVIYVCEAAILTLGPTGAAYGVVRRCDLQKDATSRAWIRLSPLDNASSERCTAHFRNDDEDADDAAPDASAGDVDDADFSRSIVVTMFTPRLNLAAHKQQPAHTSQGTSCPEQRPGLMTAALK